MIREEEDDMTQEIRQMISLEVKQEIEKLIKNIEEAKIPVKDEVKDDYTTGVVDGLEWAVRIISGDKSAS